MRLLNQVRLGQYSMWPTLDKTWKLLDSYGVLNLEDVIPVDITNVYEWMETDWDLDNNVAKRKQVYGFCTDLRPSFKSTWFEWRMNKINQHGKRPVKVDGRAIWAVNCPDVFPGWTMLFFERQDGDVILSHIFAIELDLTTAENIQLQYPSEEGEDDDPTWAVGFIGGVTVPVILAQNLMHCKNVKVERTDMPPKLAKKFARNNGGKQPARFRMVKIEPMKKVMVNCGGVQGVGVQKAMHIVRGHFAEYTEERPLFGHFTGKVFRAQHVRGDEKLGVKKPDYAVVRPAKGKAA